MLDLFGRGYVIDHCVAEIKRQNKKNLLQTYVTDALRLISESCAKLSGGSYLSVRFVDILNPPKKDERTAEQIIEDITNGLAELGGEE